MAQEIEITFRVEPEQAAALLEFLSCVLRADIMRALGACSSFTRVTARRIAIPGLRSPYPARCHVRVQARARVGCLLRKSGSEPSPTLRTGRIIFKRSVERFRQIGRENVEAKEAGR
jgi:hypothetical protein